MAENWIMILKLLVNSEVEIPKNFCARIKCPVLEMGRNSVSPSIMASMIVWG